jgi:hypothetical protein
MKQGLLLMLVFCCTALMATAQAPTYEYVLFDPRAGKGTVELPDFTVQLKGSHKPEKTTYKEAKRLFVISDIEGQYEALKQLLWAGGVMDKQFRWSFGKGHLVVLGDVFDRGGAVAECLWLFYHLEEQAKQAGGYLHYVLGNHELMNLSGDYRYVHPRYIELAQQAGVPYGQFYSPQTELGRWLRTKNVTEKIGPFLFMHGGISQLVNEWGPTLDTLNGRVRPYYDHPGDSTLPATVAPLLSDEGPMWYRGYYIAPTASSAQVDSTLKQFRVKTIVTGHTPVSRIAAFHGGKVINVDVPHAKGASEALLTEGRQLYRVNLKGEKTQLELH